MLDLPSQFPVPCRCWLWQRDGMPGCPECGTVFPQHPGRGRPSVFCSTSCRRRAKRRRETQRTHAQVREWYQAVADGKITDDPIIGPEWAREWLRWQDGEVDDPLVAVLGMPTAGS
jgi:hypothetical protein